MVVSKDEIEGSEEIIQYRFFHFTTMQCIILISRIPEKRNMGNADKLKDKNYHI